MTSWDLRFYFFLSTLLHSTIGKKVRAVNFSGDRYLENIKYLELQPQFLAPLENHTVTQGRDVFFTCVVNHLQSYKVAWIKSDSRAILAMHTHMVTPNPRLSVTHNGHNTWKLHVVNVQPDDSGTYMCQVNTEPMRSQIGHMKVVIPPDIIDVEDSSNRLTSIEGGSVRLRCRASGSPKPEITWRREDGRSIIIRSENERALVIRTYKNENLYLTGILRQEMGSYLCIASNGIPPTVSKRYYINVLFKPTIIIKNQIVFARINHNVSLECYIESSPKSFTVWYTENGQKIGFDEKYIISETAVDDYTFQINLTIRGVRPSDFNIYTCLTENPFGKTNAVIKLRG
ncbi:PREDICTED: lachesin-like [Ceratosolen solmsi marchali]|uniref:Lachesin-like n=1 Tax=Ceratosolen solmsi marchali TaxID=326594 RepID=A0AAJ6VJV4_9HYME|nr:PREDICTED: lachesin-like [Ceratosolen solmsi marchali]